MANSKSTHIGAVVAVCVITDKIVRRFVSRAGKEGK